MSEIRVCIRTLGRAEIAVSLPSPSSSIDDLCLLLEQQWGVDRERQKIVFRGELLSPQQTLEEAKIGNNDFVVLIAPRAPKVEVTEMASVPIEITSIKPVASSSAEQSTPAKTTATAPSVASPPPPASNSSPAVREPPTQSTPPVAARAAPAPPPASAPSVAVNDELVAQLEEMGFPRPRSVKALQLNRNNAQLAMEWLIEHESDLDIDTPLTDEQLSQLTRGNRRPQLSEQEALQRMLEMGFSEEDIASSLEATGHNYEAACAWLLGERDAGGGDDEEQDESEIARHMPEVAQALSNPAVVAALETISQDPSTLPRFLADPNVGPVLALLAANHASILGGEGGEEGDGAQSNENAMMMRLAQRQPDGEEEEEEEEEE